MSVVEMETTTKPEFVKPARPRSAPRDFVASAVLLIWTVLVIVASWLFLDGLATDMTGQHDGLCLEEFDYYGLSGAWDSTVLWTTVAAWALYGAAALLTWRPKVLAWQLAVMASFSALFIEGAWFLFVWIASYTCQG